MAWEQRNGRPYYYLSARVNGRPTRRYLGRGDQPIRLPPPSPSTGPTGRQPPRPSAPSATGPPPWTAPWPTSAS